MLNFILRELSALTGTIVNAGAIIVGSALGMLIKGGIKEKYNQIIMQAIGLSVILLGISGAIAEMLKPESGKILFIVSLVIGGAIGEWLNIEGRINAFAEHLQKNFKGKGKIKEGFVTTTLIYCVGSMAIIGSLKSGISGEHSILYTKSILDGISSVIFASSLGFGVLLSSIPVLIYQGLITIFSFWIQPFMTDVILSEISLVGGILIMTIGLNMLEITKIRLANFLPSLFVPVVYYALILPFVHTIFG